MALPKFKDYYVKSLVKDPNEDYNFDSSDNWYLDHTAITSKGSFAIGIIEENTDIVFRNFLDINILPVIFNTVKKNEKNEIVFLTKESNLDNYIYESLCKKFPQRTFVVKKAGDNIVKEIRMLELENKIAITILESNKVFSLKHIIEFI